MSVVFVPKRQRGKAQINQETIQRLLDENDQLVRCITEYLQKGRATECVQYVCFMFSSYALVLLMKYVLPLLHRYQQILHRNIVYLGTIADAGAEIVPEETQTSANDSVS
ncbi:unnamed protein product [Leuciscus chuanchicus]